MRRYFAGLAAITITIGTLVTAQSAGAFERYRAEGYNVTTFEPYERTSSPTWSPTWEPTWTPEPQMPEPTSEPTYTETSYAPASGALTAAQVASYLSAAGFPEDVVPVMVQIAYRESHFIPTAINPVSSACGLTQIWPFRTGCTDPATNCRMAYAKYVAAQEAGGSGLEPWALTAP